MMPVKDPAESVVVEFDFSVELDAVDDAAAAVSVDSGGADAAVAAMLVGAPQISGASVYQRVSAGVAGVNYKLRCVATRGDAVIVRAAILPVRVA